MPTFLDLHFMTTNSNCAQKLQLFREIFLRALLFGLVCWTMHIFLIQTSLLMLRLLCQFLDSWLGAHSLRQTLNWIYLKKWRFKKVENNLLIIPFPGNCTPASKYLSKTLDIISWLSKTWSCIYWYTVNIGFFHFLEIAFLDSFLSLLKVLFLINTYT